MLAMYPYILGPQNGIELRYSLRSLPKWIEPVIVGEIPNWYGGREIRMKQSGSRLQDVTFKMLRMCKLSTDPFVYMYDDQYFLTDWKPQTIAVGPMPAIKQSASGWHQLQMETWQELSALPKVWDYETHLPRIFEPAKLRQIIDYYQVGRRNLLVSTLYYNEYFQKPDTELTKDKSIKALIRGKMPAESIDRLAQGKKVMNSGHGLNPELIKWLQKRFPEPSKHERNAI